jgi:hypothetical protein
VIRCSPSHTLFRAKTHNSNVVLTLFNTVEILFGIILHCSPHLHPLPLLGRGGISGFGVSLVSVAPPAWAAVAGPVSVAPLALATAASQA